MQLGIIGLGRMGANMARRLHRHGIEVVGHDLDTEAVRELESEGVITGAPDGGDLCRLLTPPRSVWVMVPAGVVDRVVDGVIDHLEEGDTIIDGGNSFHRDSLDRAARLAERGIHHVDVGVSGGVWGLEYGYSLMIGGEDEPVARLTPVFSALAPGVEAAGRTPGKEGDAAPGEEGWLHCGPPGSGHFTKMVHNGIEYGMMAAIAEGFAILERADVGMRVQEHDAETAPLRDPEYYRYDFDLAAIAEVWRRGTVIRSWLIDLAAAAFAEDPDLAGYEGRVSDSGEGRWTVQAAVDEGVPANVLAASLYQRFASRDQGDHGDRLLSALREQFGGHEER